jgi:S-adenosylmethionine:tRNA ribosyltransferase-isomerase
MTPSSVEAQHRSWNIAPAREPRQRGAERLLVIDPLTLRFGDYRLSELPKLLGPGDVLVLNDAATLPASLRAEPELELRLVASEPDGDFRAIALGAGDRLLPTEERGPARQLAVGETLTFSPELRARVVEIDAAEPRLVRLRFDARGAAFWQALYAHGQPIQYAYLEAPLALWDVQNRFAARPWAFEMPSAARPLSFELLFAIERRGAVLAPVTHAAGVSSTGSPTLDARLPLDEEYELGVASVRAMEEAQALGGRVIAAGTSAMRALEANAEHHGRLQAERATARSRLGESSALRVVDGLLTGLHEPTTSHFELLESLAPRSLLLRALEHAARTGYLQHELGDSCLILAGSLLERLSA